MYTDCPGCERQFRLTAVHLSAAGGEVRCGFCGLRFSALDRLRDQPLPVAESPAAGSSPGSGPGEEEARDAESGNSAAVPDLDEPEFDIAMAEPLPAAPVAMAWTPRGELPGLQEEYEEESGSRGMRFLWMALILLLLLFAAAQLAWWERDRLLDRYPRYRAHVEHWCAKLGCSVLRQRDLSAISVVNRDVRDHPRYEDALLVNTTIRNDGEHAQPFPAIQLAFSDTSGRVLAARAFTPGEYLDGSVNLEQGMLPGVPYHVVLEIAGPGASAASFEIGFR